MFQNSVAAGFELLSREPEQRESVGQQGDGHCGCICARICVAVECVSEREEEEEEGIDADAGLCDVLCVCAQYVSVGVCECASVGCAGVY